MLLPVMNHDIAEEGTKIIALAIAVARVATDGIADRAGQQLEGPPLAQAWRPSVLSPRPFRRQRITPRRSSAADHGREAVRYPGSVASTPASDRFGRPVPKDRPGFGEGCRSDPW